MPKRDPDFYSSDDLNEGVDPGAMPDDDDAAAFLKEQEAKGKKGSAAKRSNQAKSKISETAAPSVSRDLSITQIRESLNEKIREAFKKYNLEGLASSPDYLKSRANVKSFLEKYAEKMPNGPAKEKFLAEVKNIEEALVVLKSNPTMMQLDQSSAAIDKYTESLAQAASEHASAPTTAPTASGVSTDPTKTNKPVDPLKAAVSRQKTIKDYAKGAGLTHESLDDPATMAELEKLGINAQEIRMALGPKPAPVQTGLSDDEKRKLAAAQALEGGEAPAKVSPIVKQATSEAEQAAITKPPKGKSWVKGAMKNPLMQMLVPTEAYTDLKKAGEARKLIKEIKTRPDQLKNAEALVSAERLAANEGAAQAAEQGVFNLAKQRMSVPAELAALPKRLTTRAVVKAANSIPGYLLLSMLAGGAVSTLGKDTGLPITPENRAIQAQEELAPSLDDMMIQAEIQARQQDRAAEAIRNNPQLAAQLQSQDRIEQAAQQGRAAHTYSIGGSSGFNSSATDLMSLIQGG